ncbi:unnamed protein product [Alopecurus aequalis]
MERSSSLARCVALLLALMCCSTLACSAVAQVSVDGYRVGHRSPSPLAPGGQSTGCRGAWPSCDHGRGTSAPPPPTTATSSLAPHRKTLHVAANVHRFV